MHYDVIIIGAGPGGIFSAYELSHQCPDLKIAVFEAGHGIVRNGVTHGSGPAAVAVGVGIQEIVLPVDLLHGAAFVELMLRYA